MMRAIPRRMTLDMKRWLILLTACLLFPLCACADGISLDVSWKGDIQAW